MLAPDAHGGAQAWYEEGGVVTQAVYLMLAAGVGYPFYQLIQPECLLKRQVIARIPKFAASQRRLNELYHPPPVHFGALYASTFKACPPPHTTTTHAQSKTPSITRRR